MRFITIQLNAILCTFIFKVIQILHYFNFILDIYNNISLSTDILTIYDTITRIDKYKK